ncbi:thioredoxin domain-containing protein [Conexibacter sp. SYSU D00693]|uniref:DsbA family protein n=1 Tax=Conexibacter sp. SYSU D00693 TaxID=2812560 RepID=UPI00196AEB63|nr:thioredoxin domain-containing protein [Conexibacter sp. SYSU D00693]
MADDLSSAAVPGLRADDHVDGATGVELTVLYADFSCPHCAVTYLRLREARTPLAFRHFALKAKGPRAVPLACAAEAAAAQGAFWAFADTLFGDLGRQDDPHLWARCETLGLDLERFEADRRGEGAMERVRRDTREGMKAGIVSTPAVFSLRPDVVPG